FLIGITRYLSPVRLSAKYCRRERIPSFVTARKGLQTHRGSQSLVSMASRGCCTYPRGQSECQDNNSATRSYRTGIFPLPNGRATGAPNATVPRGRSEGLRQS